MPRYSEAEERRRGRLVLAVAGAALLALGLGAVAYAGSSLHRGYLDGRARHAPKPAYVYAAEESGAFYGLALAVLAVGGSAFYVGGSMLQEAWRRTGPPRREGGGRRRPR